MKKTKVRQFTKKGALIGAKLCYLFLLLLIPNFVNATVGDILMSFAGGIMDFVLDVLGLGAFFILFFLSYLVGIAGTMLNFVIQCTVVDMSGTVGKIGAITTTWGVIRDLANIAFIFILLYTAIGTILNIGVNWKKTVVTVVIIALLVNFSLFFTKIIIDASNVVALGFYENIAPTAANSTCEDFAFNSGGLSDSYLQALKLQTTFSAENLSGTGRFVTNTMGIIFVLIVTFVLFAAAIMFIVRFVILVFLMILSPIWLLGYTLPQLKQMSSKWFDTLMGQALFAPAFMILSWIVIVIINDPGFFGQSVASGGTLAIGDGVNADNVKLTMNFVIVISFMVATLVLSKSFASQGAGVVGKVMGGATSLAGGAVFGGVGRLGRGTLGKAGQMMAESKYLRDKAEKGSRFAKLGVLAGQKTSKASFDARGGAFGKITGEMGAGKAGGKGGYEAFIKEKAKRKKEFGESLGPTDIEKDKAEQELEKEKRVDLNDDAFREDWKRAVQNRRLDQSRIDDELEKMERAFAEIRIDNVAERRRKGEEISRQRRLSKEAAERVESISGITGDEGIKKYKQERVSRAQRKVDELEGVSEAEALKRAAQKRGQTIKELRADMAKDPHIREEVEGEVKKTTIKSLGSRRKASYAESLTRGWFVSRADRRAAAELRKKEKSTEETLKDLLKKKKELPEEEPGEEEEEKEDTIPPPATGEGGPTTT